MRDPVTRALTFVVMMHSLRCERISGCLNYGAVGIISITLIVSLPSLKITLGSLLFLFYSNTALVSSCVLGSIHWLSLPPPLSSLSPPLRFQFKC